MLTLSHLSFSKFHYRYIYLAGFMLFFWALFDGGFSYLVPLVITDSGYSHTYLGFVLGSSSLFGALFDVLLSKLLPNTHFRRMYLFMFAICAVSPLFLIQGSPVFLYVIAMALWGIYYDLSNFANIDFISRITKSTDHSHSSGIIWAFRSLGYTIAPLVVGITVTEVLSFTPYFLLWIFLLISFLFFMGLLSMLHQHKTHTILMTPKKRIRLSEFYLWMHLGKILFPVLVLIMFSWIFDAFFWTIGPLMGQTLTNTETNGLFLTAYTVPALLTPFFLGKITKRVGKKRTALLSCLVACFLLSLFFLTENSSLILMLTFLASCSMSLSFPALNAAFTDYVAEQPRYGKEIEALQDFFTNLGYIFGPIFAGIIADMVGNLESFAYLGIIGIYIVIAIMVITPKHITIKVAS